MCLYNINKMYKRGSFTVHIDKTYTWQFQLSQLTSWATLVIFLTMYTQTVSNTFLDFRAEVWKLKVFKSFVNDSNSKWKSLKVLISFINFYIKIYIFLFPQESKHLSYFKKHLLIFHLFSAFFCACPSSFVFWLCDSISFRFIWTRKSSR